MNSRRDHWTSLIGFAGIGYTTCFVVDVLVSSSFAKVQIACGVMLAVFVAALLRINRRTNERSAVQ